MAATTVPLLPLALTSGEPAGIGPDLCLQLAAETRTEAFVCLADRRLLEQRARQLKLSISLSNYERGAPIARAAGQLTVLHVPLPEPVQAGELRSGNAHQVLQLLDRALDGCRAAEFAAMVTAPVQKSIINEAGVPFSGHTEYLAARCGVELPVMLLIAGSLRVALATTHLPLREVSGALHEAQLVQILMILNESLQRFWGIAKPHLAVCGLNPHAGEGGHLGDEEIRVIAPAIAAARARGVDVSGPYPADTLFVPRHLEGVDAVLAMFHDQGLPVLKHAGFGDAVNVTLGLPIVRTSVDHGTALDLAGTGRADPGSLRAALHLAAQMTAKSR
ncbi:MAG: 4-hydroxythreonine-4-phosphate dehydrogenase PdxA [Steroidobacteraceae bacterium]|jgi:4-hydroxythreonine-4-phosphate dehydrogenase